MTEEDLYPDEVPPPPLPSGLPKIKESRVNTACPRCQLTNTVATSTVGRIQHRICRNPVCRWRFNIVK